MPRRFALFALLLVLMIGASIAVGQDPAQDIPPQVLAVQPFPGEEMRIDEPLTLIFNQGMDQASVESAFAIEPAIDGAFTWSDARTLQFTPADGWQRDATYEVVIGDSATADNGLSLLEAYDFTIRAAGSLQVASIIPADGVEGVEADATITVAFNRPVVPLGSTEDLENLPNPLSISPELPGKGEWLNTTIYQYVPDEPLLGGATYTVTVQASLESVTGAALTEDYTITFKTLVPEILSTYPTAGTEYLLLDETIRVSFSQPMDQAATSDAIRVTTGRGEPLAGTLSWSEDGRSATFTPAENLTIASGYTLVVDGDTAKGLGGASLREGITIPFASVPLPYIAGHSPDNSYQPYPGLNNASVRFGTPMNPDTFEGKYIIEPDPGDITPFASRTNLNLQFDAQEQTTYTVTILAGTEDIYGNAIQDDYTFSFTTSAIEDYAYLRDTWRFIVTGAYRQNTALAAEVSGTPEVGFILYEVSINDLPKMTQNLYNDEVRAQIRNAATLLEAWSTVLDTGSSYSIAKLAIAGSEGGVLPPGLYYLEMTDLSQPSNQSQPVAFGVVNSTVTYKSMDDEILIWVTDMESGDPLPNQNVTVYQSERTIATGTTDENGILRLKLDAPNSAFVSITAESEGRYGVWYTYGLPGSPTGTQAYVYTDRPIYRPGETLYFRGAVRDQNDNDFAVNDMQQVDVIVTSNYGAQELLRTTLDLTEFGTFSGELLLPEDVQTGVVSVEIVKVQNGNTYLGGVTAQVAEFRVPEFLVGVTPQQDEVIAGDPIRAVVNSDFFSGGAVSNASLTWNILSNPTFFRYTGTGRYSFADSGGDQYYYYASDAFFDPYGGYGYGGRYITEGSGTTDSNGEYVIELEQAQLSGNTPENYSIEALITDESGQTISNRSSVTVHPSEVYVGVRTEEYFARAEQPFVAEFITVTPQSEPVAEQSIAVTLLEQRWERVEIPGQFGRYDWQLNVIEVETQTLTTDANGLASTEFTPPNAGIFIVKASTFDQRERFHIASTRLWVLGDTTVYWGRPSTNIDMIADAESYQPGDTAEILIPLSYEGTSQVLITLERDGVMMHEVREVEGSTLVYNLPLTDEHAPNVYFSVVVVHGIDEDNTVPSYRQGTLSLQVEPIAKQLDLTVTPSTTTTQPGESVTFDIEARNPDGSPAEAEIGLALVDSAILTLAPPNSQSPASYFYSGIGNYTGTGVMLEGLVDGRLDEVFGAENRSVQEEAEMDDFAGASEAVLQAAPAAAADGLGGGGGGGGGGGFETVTVREDFQQTPLWAPHVVTDENGQAQVSVTLPDNLTIWNLDARALTTDTVVGNVEVDVASTLPLLVRPVTPRFFVVGDEVTLAMVVNNNTPQEQAINTTMQGTGYELIGDSELVQAVSVAANSRVRVEWRVKILDVTGVDLTFIAQGENGIQDAAKPPLATGADDTIPVYRYTAPDTTATGGVLRNPDGEAVTEGISIPPIADTDQGTLTLQLDPSLAVTTIDALDYLKNYPHQCIEQTVSHFLPNVMTYRALRELGVDDPALREQLEIALAQGLEKLASAQNPDGGWGWFDGMESSTLVTAYAVLGLSEAASAGFPVPQPMIERALPTLLEAIITPGTNTPQWTLNRQAFLLYVLGRADANISQTALDALYAYRLELSQYAKGYLLSAYLRVSPAASDPIQALTSDLITAAKVSATGAHWEEDWNDWWNWNTDIRSTSIILSALIQAEPDNVLLPNVVRWLMIARQGDHWRTTQETAWAVMGLTDWMVATNELQGNYDFTVAINSEESLSAVVTPDNVREGKELEIAIGDLLLDEINRVSIIRSEGEGALYYTAHLQLRLDAAEVDAIDRGVSISREYFVEGVEQPVTEVTMGDTITVRVTLTTDETLYYFVLEDPLPAGTEVLDTSLLTTSQTAQVPNLRSSRDRSPFFYWYWWIWDQTDIRDEQVRLYADQLPPGTYVYSYQIQATVPGDFQTMPSHGYAFYFPEVFGRSDGVLFTVNPAEE